MHKKPSTLRVRCLIILISGLTTFGGIAEAETFDVTVDTTPLQGLSGYFALDLLAGSVSAANSATVTAFLSNGTLGPSTASGDVSGTLTPGPLVLGTMQFFNEWLQQITFGTSMSFQLSLTENLVGATPDAFSFFLLNAAFLPYDTSDPTGADALFAIDITGTPLTPSVYQSAVAAAQVTPQEVPEPPSWILLAVSGLVAAMAGAARGRIRGR